MSFYKKQRNGVLSWLPDLPTIVEGSILSDDDIVHAIVLLDKLQKDIETIPEPLKKSFTEYKKIPALLYAMMDFAPLNSAREKVAKAIVDCGTSNNTDNTVEERLIELGEHYFYFLLSPFKTSRIKTPSTSASSSPHSANADRDLIAATLTPTQRSNVKAEALKRDSYRCLISGILDTCCFHEGIEERVANTQATHIIPFHLNRLDSRRNGGSTIDQTKVNHSATFWQIVSWFGEVDYKNLDGQKINSLENILTLDTPVHQHFDNLKLWFEETSLNHYAIHYAHAAFMPHQTLEDIHLTTPDATMMPIPNRAYLRLHAACAKIAHMSGMGEVLDKWDREVDNMDVLASDGSSMHLLASKLTVFNDAGFVSRSSLVSGVA